MPRLFMIKYSVNVNVILKLMHFLRTVFTFSIGKVLFVDRPDVLVTPE